jgi:hypothetical protein
VGVLGKIKIFVVSFWVPLRKRVGFKNKQFSAVIKLKKFNRFCFFTIKDSVDFAVIEELFLNEEYGFDYINDPKVIFDIGGNIGVATC